MWRLGFLGFESLLTLLCICCVVRITNIIESVEYINVFVEEKTKIYHVEDKYAVNQRIREIRDLKNLQEGEKFARKLSVKISGQTIRKIFDDESVASTRVIQAILMTWGNIDGHYLLTGKGSLLLSDRASSTDIQGQIDELNDKFDAVVSNMAQTINSLAGVVGLPERSGPTGQKGS